MMGRDESDSAVIDVASGFNPLSLLMFGFNLWLLFGIRQNTKQTKTGELIEIIFIVLLVSLH